MMYSEICACTWPLLFWGTVHSRGHWLDVNRDMFLTTVGETGAPGENPHRHGENMQIPHRKVLPTQELNPGPCCFEATVLNFTSPAVTWFQSRCSELTSADTFFFFFTFMFEACSYFKLSHFKNAISKTSSTCCTSNNIINEKRVFIESCSA